MHRCCLQARIKPLGACQFGQRFAFRVGGGGIGDEESLLCIPVVLLI